MSALRDFISVHGRRAQFQARRIARVPRAMPGFILIGAQKSGTSSMFAYLKQHPQIVRPIFKELYYFDRHYHRGLDWYGCNFPARSSIERRNDRHGRPHYTFEATATYIFDADVPKRISSDIETRKFIVLLRNPVDRAISAYWHARRMGRETRTLDEAMKMDRERCEAELAFEAGSGPEPAGPTPRPIYVRRGIYHEAVARWQKEFSPQNLLVLQSETMFADPAGVMKRVFAFLGLAPEDGIDWEPQNVGRYDGSDSDARVMLRNFYRPHNERLNAMTADPLLW
ncbi:MAG TPA: sulfotransferase domain-containing protein [Micropepsaceae bacterium]|jgi:hypothetical protein|nr:sulfotransferase domain-containing protein [Micropepsaceae bacterium]